MTSSNLVRQAVRHALWASAIAASVSMSAFAADADMTEVVVTGSRIVAPNMESTSPIQVVTAKDIQVTGKTDISDILFQLPQNFNNSLGQDFSGRTSGLTTPGGVTTADLRGLGPQRTLVLVNGRRLGQGSPNTAIASPAPDLDQIPAGLVERVDVVTGGASATYGSDAIAGVVNFIMKKNFEGIQLDAQWGENWHENHSSYVQSVQATTGGPLGGVTAPTGTTWDGRNVTFNAIFGANFDSGKGNVTAYLTYIDFTPVTSGQRDFGSCQLNSNTQHNGTRCSGSANSNYFRLNGIQGPSALISVDPRLSYDPVASTTFAPTAASAPDLAVVGNQFAANSAAVNPPALFNSQPFIYMSRGDQRYMGGFFAHDDLNDYVQPYIEFMFMDDKTHQGVAPSALFRDSNPTDANTGNYYVNCSNPLLSAQQQATLCTVPEITADQAQPGTVLANVRIGRRNVEGVTRFSDFAHTNYRGVIGAKGDFATAWSYDAYAQYYYTSFFNSNTGFLSFNGINNALLVKGTAANPVCFSGPPCIPYNIWTQGGVTQAAISNLYVTGTSYGTVTERIMHADVTGDLGKYGVKLPTAGDGVRVNVGFEHRGDKVTFTPDAAELGGDLSGFGGASVALNNGLSVDEEFVEVLAPIIDNMTGVQHLALDAGYRSSDYTTSGKVNTYKFEVQYSPIEDLLVRGSYQRAIRAPLIIELYNPQNFGLIAIGEDPCAPAAATGVATATAAQCANTGVTAAQYGNGSTTNRVPQGTGSQLGQLTGGNPNLKPETANTYSIGLTLKPGMLSTFTGSVDYFHIEIKDEVGTISPTLILNNCLSSGSPFYCGQIVRTSTGALTGSSVASGGYIVQTSVNVGAAKVSGFDLQAGYKLALPADFGSVDFTMAGTIMMQNSTIPFPGGPTIECKGLFGASCQTVNPRWRHNFRVTWETPWQLEAALTWRYIGKVGLDNNDSDPNLNGAEFGKYNSFNAEIPAYNYLDLALTYHVWDSVSIRGGINNIFDKDPPIVTSEITSGGAANTYETYDTLGRQVFVGITAKF